MLTTTFMDPAIAAGLGLRVGLYKERADSPLAGLRTFGIVSLAGAVAALIAEATTPWLIVGGLFAVAAMMVTGNIVLIHAESRDEPARRPRSHTGPTTCWTRVRSGGWCC